MSLCSVGNVIITKFVKHYKTEQNFVKSDVISAFLYYSKDHSESNYKTEDLTTGGPTENGKLH
jgi:hypothetical protein